MVAFVPHSKQNRQCLLSTQHKGLKAQRSPGIGLFSSTPVRPGLQPCWCVLQWQELPIQSLFHLIISAPPITALCCVCPPRGTCVVAARLTGLLAVCDPTENPSLFKHTSVWFRSTNCNRKRLSEGLRRSTMYLQANPCSNIQDGKEKTLSESNSCMMCVLNHLLQR